MRLGIRYSHAIHDCATYKKMSEFKKELPNSPDNNEASSDSNVVESGAEEAKQEKEEKWIIHGDYNFKIKIPEEKKEEK